MTIRKDGKVPSKYYSFNYPNANSDEAGAKEYAGRILIPECQKYQHLNSKVAQAYWKGELLDFIPVWQKNKRHRERWSTRRPASKRSSTRRKRFRRSHSRKVRIQFSVCSTMGKSSRKGARKRLEFSICILFG